MSAARLLTVACIAFGPGLSASAQDAPDQVVTRFIPLKEAPGQAVKELLEHYASEGADVSYYAPTNTVIVTDTRRNVQRLRTLARAVDQPPLTGPPVQVFSDARTNQVIIVGSGAQANQAQRLIQRLDRPPSPRGQSGIFLYRLQNAHAPDVQRTLDAVFGGGNGRSGSAAPRNRARQRTKPSKRNRRAH